MQELIERLRDLIAALGTEELVRHGCKEASLITSRDWGRIRGCLDLLLAMEERTDTIRLAHLSPGTVPFNDLLEKA